MDDETWLEDVRREAGPCPRCQAHAARPIRHGMPVAPEEPLRSIFEGL